MPEDKEQIREYVITMGPLHPSSYEQYVPKKKLSKMDTCTEFWKMCWMTGSRIIVMLCDVSPGFQVKSLTITFLFIFIFIKKLLDWLQNLYKVVMSTFFVSSRDVHNISPNPIVMIHISQTFLPI